MSKKKKAVEFDPEMKEPMSLTAKIVLVVIALAVVIAGIYLAYYLIHYNGYRGYEQYLTDYEYETGSAFTPASDSTNNVAGYDLVAENNNLKLYTDTATGYIALYDKRDGQITYSNPVNTDDDPIANETIKNAMRSAFILEYFNPDVQTGTFDSYTKCVKTGGLKAESIQDGIRYIYNIGESNAKFNIPLEYRLGDDYVSVSVPTKGIEELGTAYVFRIQLLRYFGAADSSENGCIVVPNNSGALINFNNGKTTASQYSQFVYDLDPMAANFTTIEEAETVKLPIFGLCRENSSILASIEDGETIARITAAASGALNDYNYAYVSFTYRNSDDLSMFGDSSQAVYVMENDMYDVNCTVRYTKLTSENKGYAGLANYYRERLIAEGRLDGEAPTGDIPFYYDVLGGVQETSHILGVQYQRTFPMTTFSQASEIASDLNAKGVNNQVLNYEGWMNRGYYHDAADKVNIVSSLGNKKDLENLSSQLEGYGGKLYADVAFAKVSNGARFFNFNAQGSRYYGGGYVATFGLVNPTTLRSTSGLGYDSNRYTVLSPKFLDRYVGSFSDIIKGYDITGVSLRDLGSYVSSDKKRTNLIDREKALDITLAQLERIDSTGKDLCMNEANLYAFKYADDIINTPTETNEYYLIDEAIPLYQMIIHGSIDYSGNLLNFYDMEDMNPKILQMIEYGAAPHYMFTYEDSNKMKTTAMNRFYATTYENWSDEAVDVYNKVNEALKNVSGAKIVGHEIIGDARKITYSNGVKIYINYGNEVVTVDGVQVPACSYRMEGV